MVALSCGQLPPFQSNCADLGATSEIKIYFMRYNTTVNVTSWSDICVLMSYQARRKFRETH